LLVLFDGPFELVHVFSVLSEAQPKAANLRRKGTVAERSSQSQILVESTERSELPSFLFFAKLFRPVESQIEFLGRILFEKIEAALPLLLSVSRTPTCFAAIRERICSRFHVAQSADNSFAIGAMMFLPRVFSVD
jgi:hypothetical protein